MRLERIEGVLERLVEGAFGRAFGGALHPLEVYRALWRAVEAGRVVSASAVYAPNRLTAYLSLPDMEQLQGLRQQLESEFADQLHEEAREQGWSCGPLVVVSLQSSTVIRPGAVRALASMDEAPLPATLTVTAGDDAGTVFDLHPGMVLGRAAKCDLRLADEAVSRRQCRLDWTFDGFLVTDLGSRNGTFVNDVQVSTRLLGDADELRVGFSTLRLAYDVAAARARMAPPPPGAEL